MIKQRCQPLTINFIIEISIGDIVFCRHFLGTVYSQVNRYLVRLYGVAATMERHF